MGRHFDKERRANIDTEYFVNYDFEKKPIFSAFVFENYRIQNFIEPLQNTFIQNQLVAVNRMV